MNKIYLVVSLCVLITVTNAYAAPVGSFYAGVSVGKLEGKLEVEDEDLPDFEDTNFKFFGGYQFNSLLAIEGHYTKLDDTQNALGSDVGIEAKTLGVSAKFTPVRGSKITPFGKIGINKIDSEEKVNGVIIGDEDDTKLAFGLGMEAQVAKNVSLRAEYERFRSDFNMLSAGIAVSF